MRERPIRLMIVDDSLVFRSLLRDMLSEDAGLDVVSQAVNGKLALPRIRHYRPDFLILDQEMPEMDGLELLALVRRDFPEIGVVMFSAHTSLGAKVTIRALELGALDFVTKPVAGGDAARKLIRERLIPLIKELAVTRLASPQKMPTTPMSPVSVRPGHVAGTGLRACAIGISTGGPAALHRLLPALPKTLHSPLFIVQHMPPLFTRQLAESLDAASTLTVHEGQDGDVVEAGHVYIAPGGKHMIVRADADGERPRIAILDTPAENNCKPAVNVLFRSVAEVYGPAALGVLMTGMGNDGYEGLRLMRERGGYLIGQSEASCLIFGMPAQATREGFFAESLDIPGIAARIAELLGGGQHGA